LLDSLSATDLIDQHVPHTGGQVKRHFSKTMRYGEQTVIYPTGRFLSFLYEAMVHDLMRDIGRFQPKVEAECEEVVMLKSLSVEYTDDPASLVHYEDDEVSTGYRRLTHRFNIHLQHTTMSLLDPERPSSTTGVLIDTRNRMLKRVFN